jgi:hypothetical protein
MIIGTTLYSNRKSYIDLSKLKVKNTNLLGPVMDDTKKQTYANDLEKKEKQGES